jgi:hypothetical protein
MILHFRLLLLTCLMSSLADAQTDPQTQQALDGLAIRPSATDAAITDFDDPHWIYVNRDIVVKNDARACLPTAMKCCCGFPARRHPVRLRDQAECHAAHRTSSASSRQRSATTSSR